VMKRRKTLPAIQTTHLPQVPASATSAPTYRFSDRFLPELPSNPESWTCAHVSLYLSHRLRLTPKPIVDDLTRFIKEDARLTGKRFLNLTEADLISMQFQESWRKAIMTGIKLLRRESRNMDFMPEVDEEDALSVFDTATTTNTTNTTSSRMGSEYTNSTATSMVNADLAEQLAELKKDLNHVRSTLAENKSPQQEVPSKSFFGDWSSIPITAGFVEGLAVGAVITMLGLKFGK